jgi:hypothetical protein
MEPAPRKQVNGGVLEHAPRRAPTCLGRRPEHHYAAVISLQFAQTPRIRVTTAIVLATLRVPLLRSARRARWGFRGSVCPP